MQMLSSKKLRMRVSNVNSHSFITCSQDELCSMVTKCEDMDTRLAMIKQLIKQLYGKELYDEQLMTVIAMLEGDLVEVKTGEGKSLCVATYTAMKALLGDKVYVVTTNTYLSLRDHEEFKKLFDTLNITLSYNIPFTDYPNLEAKSEIHSSDVIFTDCCELVFDYLRDRINGTELVKLNTAILDEIDFVLIDNASTTCNLVGGEGEMDMHYIFYMQLFSSLFDNLTYTKIAHDDRLAYNLWNVDFVCVESNNTVIVTDYGLSHIESMLGQELFSDGKLSYLLEVILMAYFMYEINVDYTIEDGKCTVINKNNGRSTKGTAFEIDIQNALELKHNLKLTPPPKKNELISYQVFYNKFDTLVGLSGTLVDAETEFKDIFKKDIYVIPTHKEIIRKDNATRYFKTEISKRDHLLNLINNLKVNHPVLVVTDTDSSAKQLFKFISSRVTEAKLLTNDNIDEEIEILEHAGDAGSVLISTPIVGRGTDIKISKDCESTGLAVIMYCHFDNSRIDTQVRGRSGRQGEHGVTYTLSSLDDTVWNMLGEDKLKSIKALDNKVFYTASCQKYLDLERSRLQRLITSSLETARKTQFVQSMITEEFIQKLNTIYSEGLSRDNIVSILNFRYGYKYELSDSYEIYQLAFYCKYPEDTSFKDGNLRWINKSEYINYFEDFISLLRTYVSESSVSDINKYIVETHEYAQNQYMFTLKKFIYDFLYIKEE